MRSWLNHNRFGGILARLVRSGQIWQDRARFRPKSSKICKPITDWYTLETNTTWSRQSETPFESVVGQNFPRPMLLGQVWVRHKPDPA